MGKRCDICHGVGGDLVAVCACYKKSEDFGMVHLECWALLHEEQQNGDEYVEPRPEVCPRCKTRYRVGMDSKFVLDLQHCCRLGVLRHAFDMVVVIITLGCVTITLYILDWGKIYHDNGRGGLLFLVILLVISCVSVLLTIQRVLQRWKVAASDTTAVELAV